MTFLDLGDAREAPWCKEEVILVPTVDKCKACYTTAFYECTQPGQHCYTPTLYTLFRDKQWGYPSTLISNVFLWLKVSQHTLKKFLLFFLHCMTIYAGCPRKIFSLIFRIFCICPETPTSACVFLSRMSWKGYLNHHYSGFQLKADFARKAISHI